MSTETPPQGPTRSESTVALTKALVKAQASLVPARRNADNPFMKSRYADLAAIWEVCRHALTTNGLAVTQLLQAEAEGHVLSTILLHESGEWLESRLRVLSLKPNDPQSFGSALTYARRYALAAIVGVAVEGEDDDGSAASAGSTPRSTQPQARRGSAPIAVSPPTSSPSPSKALPSSKEGGDIPDVGTLLTRASAIVDAEGRKIYPNGEAVRRALGVDPGPKGNLQIIPMHKSFDAAYTILVAETTPPSQGHTEAVEPSGASTEASEDQGEGGPSY